MSARCQVTGRDVGFGNRVSLSHRRSRRRWSPNIQTATGRAANLMASNEIRSIANALTWGRRKSAPPTNHSHYLGRTESYSD
jgi:ribosomal protein L28